MAEAREKAAREIARKGEFWRYAGLEFPGRQVQKTLRLALVKRPRQAPGHRFFQPGVVGRRFDGHQPPMWRNGKDQSHRDVSVLEAIA
jgi:hypothetical protein